MYCLLFFMQNDRSRVVDSVDESVPAFFAGVCPLNNLHLGPMTEKKARKSLYSRMNRIWPVLGV